MNKTDKRKSLALLAKILRAEDLVRSGMAKQIRHKPMSRAWERGCEQEERNREIANNAHDDLRRLLERQP